ncbi:hypothetical protein H6G74_15495 [Nostoc spongiaeforme FACHB-130]|uniref:Virulence-associated protein E-like domain-containing protein n=1 Tax=Nostoc spongiaeforme FACHB-130 TaxID=1357510 RepID=A0ABR8FYG5_9NOSO|nr:VapE domain-containing protein [Nostoc spongiaeforme]MBD2595721.1 hypothetical protein [Nostoc spongiaeforme FACHB-130]
MFHDSTDNYSQSSFDINWYNPTINEDEKEAIKKLTVTSLGYSQLRKIASNVGEDIIRPDVIHDSTSGMDKSRCSDTKSSQSNLSIVQKLRNVIYFAYHNNSKLGRDALIFDMWASGELGAGYRINSLTKDIELGDRVIDPEDLYHDSWITYRRALGLEMNNKEQFISLLLNYLRDRKINPWKEQIDKITPLTPEEFNSKHGFDPHRLCEYITGDDRELQQFLWLVQFIGVMTRTYEPGCPHDHMLVLMSTEKGLRKTTLLRTLAKNPESKETTPKYYVQLRTLKSDKKEAEKLRGKIIVNLDECDSAFRGTNSDDLKEAITSTFDTYRASYGRVAKDWERTCVLFGTTNTIGLLQDYLGDRRIFPVQVRKVIDIDWVTSNWADFWGFYKWAYGQMKAGNTQHYRNYLSKTEESLLVACQADYKAREPWLDALEGVMDVLEQAYPSLAVKASDILAVIGNEIESKKRYIADHIKDVLKAERGYQEGRPRLLDGKQPGKPVMYLTTPEDNKPYPVSREKILDAYHNYLKGSYPEDKPAYRRQADSKGAREVNKAPEVPNLLPDAPKVNPDVSIEDDDINSYF